MRRLFHRSKIAFLGTLLVLSVTLEACSPSGDRSLVAVAIEAKPNTLDGCTACGCRTKGELEPDAQREWWISFGLVRADAQGGWEAAAPVSHCGHGSFEEAAPDFRRTVGTPYIVLDLSTTAAVPAAGDVTLEVQLRLQKLSGFDPSRQPVYARSMQERMLSFASVGEVTLPLLIPDAQEKASFGVHEVLLRLRAKVLGREPAASYGSLSVTADVPAADVLLDGGFVGRIAEGKPILVENVRVGARDVRVRDFSGREVQRQVVVEKDRTVEVALKVLDLTPADPPNELVPIGENPQGQQEYWRVRDGAALVRIPAGEFLMGSAEDQGEPDERPQHRVYASEFLIDKTEVTWRQFRKFAAATGSPVPPAPVSGTQDDYPVSFIVWQEAQEYCEWAGGRLPTEAEWEKAARGTDGRSYPWGNAWEPNRCNAISGGMHRPESVGSYPGCMSPYGVLAMPGSMWEWCADWYAESYYAESPARNPRGPAAGHLRVMRGGAWMSQPMWLRAAYRAKALPSSRNVDHAFRCAQDAPE